MVGPLPITERRKKYILTFIDHFTRFFEAVPIARRDTETTAREFVTKIINQFDVSQEVVNSSGCQLYICPNTVNMQTTQNSETAD